ncbi:uncharacterized protein LOC141853572 [Brevipalpus obovatus]|uniref:uncharacterized protein LOC141853572 n=1 Tax=Brevipalpus obovatus TaxID=246614 RepID=UPI003D9F99E3
MGISFTKSAFKPISMDKMSTGLTTSDSSMIMDQEAVVDSKMASLNQSSHHHSIPILGTSTDITNDSNSNYHWDSPSIMDSYEWRTRFPKSAASSGASSSQTNGQNELYPLFSNKKIFTHNDGRRVSINSESYLTGGGHLMMNDKNGRESGIDEDDDFIDVDGSDDHRCDSKVDTEAVMSEIDRLLSESETMVTPSPYKWKPSKNVSRLLSSVDGDGDDYSLGEKPEPDVMNDDEKVKQDQIAWNHNYSMLSSSPTSESVKKSVKSKETDYCDILDSNSLTELDLLQAGSLLKQNQSTVNKLKERDEEKKNKVQDYDDLEERLISSIESQLNGVK